MRHNGNLSEMDNDTNIHNSSPHIASIEHTNDDVIKTRISKSSGRLWISGTIQQSLKRISMPIPEAYHHLGDVDSRLSQSFRESGDILSKADSLDEINGDIFDATFATIRRSEDTDSECSSVNRDNDASSIRTLTDGDDDGVLVYDTHL
jgi:hypothetical protein